MLTAAAPAVAARPPRHDAFFAALRLREYGWLDAHDHAYLDYTGASLHAACQLREHQALLRRTLFGNPHSDSAPSRASTAVVARARRAVLRFLDADAAEYVVCFTANASAAIKLVGESWPFAPGTSLVLSQDNHNSVNGLREFARRAGARTIYLPLDAELRLADPLPRLERHRGAGPALFAFPAQSNFSGVQHPLELVAGAQRLGYHVLLDAAAFAPTHPLSLRAVRPDFVALSCYKLFGYPTGVGALVARRAALALLRRPWFAGGTVDYVSVRHDVHRLRPLAEGFEDGTPNYLSLAALPPGFRLLRRVGMPRLEAHVATLTAALLRGLLALRHANGRPAVRVYGPTTTEARGGTVAFNLLDAAGRPVPYARVEARARAMGVSLRGGCFCNPGAAEAAFGFPPERTACCLGAVDARGFTIPRLAACLGPQIAVGAVRASLGIASDARDVARAVAVAGAFRE
ncbi:MAG TPA: aminotransferase class V-fold PLP-dependent enzyme [Gemmatimonadaceae bacterium]|nr:aminotransferase class V-fold PLP-dependent enzyme [Gemmatimonadaceae bacterium]